MSALQETLTAEKDFHRLFDALLMEYRLSHSLPITQPTSLENVPEDHEAEFRKAYVNAARKVGQLFLEDDRLSDAWAYFRTIGEPEPVRTAIENIRIPREPDEKFDEIMNLALYEGAHVAKGLEFLLKTHGTCNTVTAFGQLQQQMDRARTTHVRCHDGPQCVRRSAGQYSPRRGSTHAGAVSRRQCGRVDQRT